MEVLEIWSAVKSVQDSALLEAWFASGMPRLGAGADPTEFSFMTEPEP